MSKKVSRREYKYKATRRLNYRLLTAEDEALHRQLYSDAEVMRFVGTPWTKERISSAFKEVLALTQQKEFNRRITAIVERSSKQVVGISSIRIIDSKKRIAEVGSMLTTPAQTKGYALEYSKTLIDHAFKYRPIDRLHAQVGVGNTAVEGLVTSLGFKPGPEFPAKDGFLAGKTWVLTRGTWKRRRLARTRRVKAKKQPKAKK